MYIAPYEEPDLPNDYDYDNWKQAARYGFRKLEFHYRKGCIKMIYFHLGIGGGRPGNQTSGVEGLLKEGVPPHLIGMIVRDAVQFTLEHRKSDQEWEDRCYHAGYM
jgi:hypothetical protein